MLYNVVAILEATPWLSLDHPAPTGAGKAVMGAEQSREAVGGVDLAMMACIGSYPRFQTSLPLLSPWICASKIAGSGSRGPIAE